MVMIVVDGCFKACAISAHGYDSAWMFSSSPVLFISAHGYDLMWMVASRPVLSQQMALICEYPAGYQEVSRPKSRTPFLENVDAVQVFLSHEFTWIL